MEDDPEIITRMALPADMKYVYPILEEMERSARERGTGIAKRSPQFLCRKIAEGKAVIAEARNAKSGKKEWAGFSYMEVWSKGEFVFNSGLIVNPVFRKTGVGRAIKQMVFTLSGQRYPRAKIFSITTGAAVLKLNFKLGFEPVTYASITEDAAFWDQCKACVNYPVLESRDRKVCLCTAMVFSPGNSTLKAEVQ